jgi:hypothetical protein
MIDRVGIVDQNFGGRLTLEFLLGIWTSTRYFESQWGPPLRRGLPVDPQNLSPPAPGDGVFRDDFADRWVRAID